MANEQHLAILRKGVEAWNMWRRQSEGEALEIARTWADLDLMSLRYQIRNNQQFNNLLSIDLQDANLEGENLQHANLGLGRFLMEFLMSQGWHDDREWNVIHLNKAKLGKADLRNAYLFRAQLNGADFSRANLRGADLGKANLSETTLFETKFKGAIRGPISPKKICTVPS